MEFFLRTFYAVFPGILLHLKLCFDAEKMGKQRPERIYALGEKAGRYVDI
jgi:hypothetical protein